jgi:DNA-binding winged helix-turn-helix (wHTH) protein/TolB-like protein
MAPGNVSEHDLVLDVRSFQLIRSGERLKLENTPMELLTLLARRRGELVTREEIISAIWGGSIHVDAEAGINTAIRKIRQALRDDPTAPKFIETVVGKGYRFIGPIEVLEPGRTDTQARHSNGTYQVPRRTAIRRLMLLVAIAILAGSFLYFWRSSARQVAGSGKRLVIAFIPFRNLSMEPGQDYFVDGMSDEILAQLGQINCERLRIVRYAAPDAAEGTPTNAELSKYGCQYVLKGSVRRSGEQARITAVLVRLADGSTQWTRSFDRPTGDFLVIQTEIAQQIGHELQIQILGHGSRQSVDPEAIEMYLHGRFELSQLHAGDAAKNYFERAIAADPSYASAYAGLVDLYRDRAIQNDRNSGQAWRLAEEYSRKALALASDSAESNAAAAQIALMHEWNWAAARQYALRALQFNPSLPEAHAVYARYLSTAGETAEALNQRKEAAALDPFRPDLQEQLAR